MTITLSQATVKTLNQHLQAAFRAGDLPRIKRITALLLLLADQQPAPAVATRLGVARSTVYGWLHAFLVDRFASLHVRKPAGRPAKLTPTQKQRLCDLIAAGPEAAGYTTGCWHSALIQALIYREFAQMYNVHYVSELLRNLGFSYQKACFVSDHLNAEQRQEWLTQRWPAIVQAARRRGALLLFGDEASFAQWGSLAYTWARRGQQPRIKTGGKRKGYKVFGLIDYFSGRLFSHGHTGRFNAQSYCDFLALVLAQTTQPLVVIQDGARYHTAAKTQEFFAQHAARLTVEQLPSYSPDYNPIEHLWRSIKRHNTHNRYFPAFSDLTTAGETALKHFQQHPEEVKQLMGTYLDEAVALACAA
ncbi:MAG: IS630 family transposase [Chloroflexi bacterium]|nr:IS630 family transposase [Chloroflexota bacterium]